MIRADASRPAGQPRAPRRHRRLVMLRIGLAGVASLLRSPKFHESVIVGVIGLASLARAARENQARTRARLAAWDKKQAMKQGTTTARPA